MHNVHQFYIGLLPDHFRATVSWMIVRKTILYFLNYSIYSDKKKIAFIFVISLMIHAFPSPLFYKHVFPFHVDSMKQKDVSGGRWYLKKKKNATEMSILMARRPDE